MPYAANDLDNWTQDRTLTWEKEYQADIITNWDDWPLNSELGIRPTSKKNRAGGRIRWLIDVNAPTIWGTAYIAPDYLHTVTKDRINGQLDFVTKYSPDLTIPVEEINLMGADPNASIDLMADKREKGIRALLESICRDIWNATGVLPGVMTGLDAAINDIVGCNVYAGVNRTTWPRFQANVDRAAGVLWAATISTRVWPLYLRSKVDGRRPTVMVCSMGPLTVFHRLADVMNFNTRVNPSVAPSGRYHGTPGAMTFMDMRLEHGGDNMPAGINGVDIFGLRMDRIFIEHVTPNLVVTENWTRYQNNLFWISTVYSQCQYVVPNPENHFRIIGWTIPLDPQTGI